MNKTYYDLLGRTTKTIAAYTDGTPTASSNQTTTYSYDGDDRIHLLTAVMPSGTNSQSTAYDDGAGGKTTGCTLRMPPRSIPSLSGNSLRP